MSAKIVLLAVLGESPGVLTETLWALAQENPDNFPAEISVMTTRKGREILQRQLPARVFPALVKTLNTQSARSLPRPRLHLQVFPSRDGLDEMTDLQCRSDIETAGDTMLRWVRGFAFEENTRIIASISGGRKSMTSLFTTCMTLLGRPGDRMVHVHVPAPYDRPLTPPFLYPGQAEQHRTPDGMTVSGLNVPVTLIDMPFIPLQNLYRAYWGKQPASFSEMVSAFQYTLNPHPLPAIRLCRKTNQLHWDTLPLSLSQLDTRFLTLFWKTKPFPAGWHVFSSTLDPEDCRKAAERVRRKLKSARIPLPEIQRVLPKFRGDPPPAQWPPQGISFS